VKEGERSLGDLLMYLSTQQCGPPSKDTKVLKKIPRRELISTSSETDFATSIDGVLGCVSKRKTGQWDCVRERPLGVRSPSLG